MPKEQQTVVAVRLSKRLHEALKAIAHERHVSLNGLVVGALAAVSGVSTEIEEQGTEAELASPRCAEQLGSILAAIKELTTAVLDKRSA